MSQGFFVYFFVSFYRERGHTRSRKLQQQTPSLVDATGTYSRKNCRPPLTRAGVRPLVFVPKMFAEGAAVCHIFTHTYTHIEVHRKETSENQKKTA